VDLSINPFEVLIGSNASGKSSFLDVVAFLSTLVSKGLEAAVEERTTNFHDLVWGRDADSFELAVEALIPDDRRSKPTIPLLGFVAPDTIRYEVGIRLDTLTEKLHIAKERVTIRRSHRVPPDPGIEVISRSNVLHLHTEAERRHYERELFDLHRNHSALNNVPADAEFPATAWLRESLRNSIKCVALDVEVLRKPSPPATSEADWSRGSYLVRSVAQLKSPSSGQFKAWLAHVKTVLPDIQDIRTEVRPDDRHRYIMIDYENGVSVPSWMVSDGTLRLLALTLLAYVPDFSGVYLVEEPENGLHPTALQAVYESLASVYEGQVLVASHSPVLLSMAKPDQLLCFIKAPDGTRIVRGSEHQALRDWQGEVSLGMLAASGILG
jgi:predicted ATPase